MHSRAPRGMRSITGSRSVITSMRSPTFRAWSTSTRTASVCGAPPPEVYLARAPSADVAPRRSADGRDIHLDDRAETLAEYIKPALREAAEAAGRPSGAVRAVAPLPVCVTDDTDAARADPAERFALYGRLPSYRAMLDREGFAGPQDAALIGDEATGVPPGRRCAPAEPHANRCYGGHVVLLT
jgi:alkanesulfonate monooxygenase SsuD/methylene tetrahydromethanopterin reductase-like flavin-dependent oxidoreductase (luciferase family)